MRPGLYLTSILSLLSVFHMRYLRQICGTALLDHITNPVPNSNMVEHTLWYYQPFHVYLLWDPQSQGLRNPRPQTASSAGLDARKPPLARPSSSSGTTTNSKNARLEAKCAQHADQQVQPASVSSAAVDAADRQKLAGSRFSMSQPVQRCSRCHSSHQCHQLLLSLQTSTSRWLRLPPIRLSQTHQVLLQQPQGILM